MSRATRLRRFVHENLAALRFSVRIWFYIYNNLYNLSIISRASKTALLRSATQFADTSAYGRGEDSAQFNKKVNKTSR